MSLTSESPVRKVTGLTEEASKRACDFLQGAVYCRCNSHPHEWFSLRDLMAGLNSKWDGTPLQVLYKKHQHTEGALERAGQDGGRLLKQVIADDSRRFDTRKAELVRQYRWAQDKRAIASS